MFWIDPALGHNILCSLYLRYCGNKSVAGKNTIIFISPCSCHNNFSYRAFNSGAHVAGLSAHLRPHSPAPCLPRAASAHREHPQDRRDRKHSGTSTAADRLHRGSIRDLCPPRGIEGTHSCRARAAEEPPRAEHGQQSPVRRAASLSRFNKRL